MLILIQKKHLKILISSKIIIYQ